MPRANYARGAPAEFGARDSTTPPSDPRSGRRGPALLPASAQYLKTTRRRELELARLGCATIQRSQLPLHPAFFFGKFGSPSRPSEEHRKTGHSILPHEAHIEHCRCAAQHRCIRRWSAITVKSVVECRARIPESFFTCMDDGLPQGDGAPAKRSLQWRVIK